jgi:hypothetical protein
VKDRKSFTRMTASRLYRITELFFIWQDQAVVKGITTVHDGSGYILQNRRRLKDSSSMPKTTKSIFDIPRSESDLTQDYKTHVSRMAMPVVRPIWDYNNGMNSVDTADQLRQDLSIRQISRRNWLPYWFFLLEHTLINAFILWRSEVEQTMVGRINEHLRKQSVFREAIITSLLESSSRSTTSLDVYIYKDSPLRPVEVSQLAARYHIISGVLRRRQCYFCRYKVAKDIIVEERIRKTYRGCLLCKLPLCVSCFLEYHQS